MAPEGPTPATSGSTMLSALPEDASQAFLAHTGPGATTSLLMAEIRQLGGALGRKHPDGGALSHFAGSFVVFAGGIAATPEMGEQAHADAMRLTGALAAWSNGRSYLNFVEESTHVRSGYAPEVWRQLTGIRSAYDPDGLFVGNHPVPRLFEDGRPTS